MQGRNYIQARFLMKRPGFTLDVELDLERFNVAIIQGASGSGKTTILRCLAGLEQSEISSVTVNGNVWQDSHFRLPTYQRPIGYVFQEDSLFTHLNVQSNILFGCTDRTRITTDLIPYIDILGIGHLLQRNPAELSGGERQRVAIARALAVKPQLLLLDEPLGSLDTDRKNELLVMLEAIRDVQKIPMIYVTHDLNEANRLGDVFIRVQNGRVIRSA